VIVEGLVQGVFFRDYTYRQALELNISGYVRNLPNRTVEAVLQGEERAVESMLAWLKQGSPRSQVKHLRVQDFDTEEQFSSFEIRY
jgi:acylphosphatase